MRPCGVALLLILGLVTFLDTSLEQQFLTAEQMKAIQDEYWCVNACGSDPCGGPGACPGTICVRNCETCSAYCSTPGIIGK